MKFKNVATILTASAFVTALGATLPVGGSVFKKQCASVYSTPTAIFQCVSVMCQAIHPLPANEAGWEACMANAGYTLASGPTV